MAAAKLTTAPEVFEAIELMNKNKISGFRLVMNKPKDPDQLLLVEDSCIPDGEADVLEKMKEGFEDHGACWGVCKIVFFKKGTQTPVPHYYLISWTSDLASVNLRMTSSVKKADVKNTLSVLNPHEVQVNSIEDLDINLLHSKTGSFSKEELGFADGRKVTGKHGSYKIDQNECPMGEDVSRDQRAEYFM